MILKVSHFTRLRITTTTDDIAVYYVPLRGLKCMRFYGRILNSLGDVKGLFF